MNSQLSQKAFDRECRILLLRLAKSRKGLRRVDAAGGSEWRLSAKEKKPVRPEYVEAMLARSLLIEMPDGSLRPSAAGLRMVSPKTPDQTLLDQHALIEPPAGPRSPQMNLTECAVHWLGNRLDKSGRPLLSDAQIAAAERIRTDFELAQLGSRVTANWDRPMGSRVTQGAPICLPERAAAARNRIFKALDAIRPELSGIILEVCCLSAGIEQAERRLTLPARSGKAVLQLALASLARHYGLAQPAFDACASLGLRSWGNAGYRPSF